jgi:L-malate glycosyltransferase
MKIKVLHIIKSLGRGGAEMLLPETLKLHNREDFEWHYIYFLPWKNQLVTAIEEAGGKVTCFSATDNLKLLAQYPKIITYCKTHQIDFIHAHLPWAGFVSRLVHFKTGIPLFYTEHNMQERYHWITKYLNRWTFNFQSMGIGVSDEVTQSIKKNIHPKIPVQTVLNGVNTESFSRTIPASEVEMRTVLGIPKNAFVVGTVAVFRFQKRLDLWLEILHHAIKKSPNIYGIIVGAGPLESEIKAKYEALQLEGKVFFVGLQTEVKPYYEAMDCFMMSSSFEGLPIALLEAMSMECAIVTTDAGGIKQVVRHEKDGQVVSVTDWKQLVSHLVELEKNVSLRAGFQKAARARVVTEFSLEVMIDELEKMYRKFKV